MFKRKLLWIMMAIIMFIYMAPTVNAATKYSKTEKKLSETLATFQDERLVDPDSFKIRRISKVQYTLNEDSYWFYEYSGTIDDVKKIKWKIDYSATNYYGGTVRETVYVSSTYLCLSENDIFLDDYNSNTCKSKVSKSFTKNVRTLTKKYYNAM